ncbi:hypothetical protein M231_02021 [Tremella mesenterica]|uniref:Uncharacterized protein n=1 Tax=Tremella mesenterica TaxID=5217 RepID=A0A4Q1BS11_TREME|nr:hypothetical protein M231_02021 [Tremella mesenterica]
MAVTSMKEDRKLAGRDNYALWNRAVQVSLGSAGLISHILNEPSTLVADVQGRYPLSGTPTNTERSKRLVAEYDLKKDQASAFSIVYGSLTETVQNKLPDHLVDFALPNPMGVTG